MYKEIGGQQGNIRGHEKEESALMLLQKITLGQLKGTLGRRR